MGSGSVCGILSWARFVVRLGSRGEPSGDCCGKAVGRRGSLLVRLGVVCW